MVKILSQSSGNGLSVDMKIIEIGLVVAEKIGLKNPYFLTKNQLFYRLVDFYRIKSTPQNVHKGPL